MKEFIKNFTEEKIENVLEIDGKFFLLSPKLDELRKSTRKQPKYAGTYLGKRKGSTFMPSFILLNILSKLTFRKTTINKKQEWNFTNSKDLNTKGKTAVDEGLVIVVNQYGEVLGLGEVKGGRLKNVSDVGDFLRREK
ncbi:hypothetical protein KY311_04665 [Candidatus Woesearchaeota archaeon]|nr:hypothetical protein [Candidatus Woesearchaeota archaeon]